MTKAPVKAQDFFSHSLRCFKILNFNPIVGRANGKSNRESSLVFFFSFGFYAFVANTLVIFLLMAFSVVWNRENFEEVSKLMGIVFGSAPIVLSHVYTVWKYRKAFPQIVRRLERLLPTSLNQDNSTIEKSYKSFNRVANLIFFWSSL